MQADRPIVKCAGDAALSAEEIQRRLRPVLTGTHLRPRVTMPLIGRAHSQKMPDRHIKDRLFTASDRILRKVRKHLIIYAADHSAVNRDANQQRHHAFRGRRDMDAVCPLIAVPLCGVDLVSVLKHADLADIRLMPLYIRMQFLKPHPSVGMNLCSSENKFFALVHLRHRYTFLSLQSMIRVISIVTIFSTAPPDMR